MIPVIVFNFTGLIKTNFMTVVELIQSMLAPGIMISACALLLLGMNNKYSMVVNRIRALDEEKRKLKAMEDEGKITTDQEHRFKSIAIQTDKLANRIVLIRNAVLSYSIGVALFIISCLTIGLSFLLENLNISYLVIVIFLTGMLAVLSGIIFAYREAYKGYEIIKVEISN
jgi:hypothetical protein